MSQTLNLNHNPIIYIYNNYMKKCVLKKIITLKFNMLQYKKE